MSIHLKSALNHIKRSPFQAMSAFFVLSITFFVITLLATLLYSSDKVVNYFETRPQLIAFLEDEIDEAELQKLKSELELDEKVSEVLYVSKEQALEIYKNATSDNPLLSELVSPSIFPASLEVSLNDLEYAQELIGRLKEEDIVDQVGFTASLEGEESLDDVVGRLKDIAWYLRIGGVVFASFLVGTSVLILIVIIGMRMTTRRDEIEVLNLIGATSAFVRSPIMLEALIYALGGVFAGWFFAFVLVLYSTPSLLSYFGEIPILPKDTSGLFSIFGIIFAVELFLGFILSIIGSTLAVSRAKKK